MEVNFQTYHYWRSKCAMKGERMNYKCGSCGGSMVYSPKQKDMLCLYCGSVGKEKKEGNDSLTICPSCGGEFDPGEFDSSSQCPYCENFVVYDKRVTEDYLPDYIIPFVFEKEDAIGEIEKEFKKRIFTPSAFLDEKRLKGMKGHYVPFFLYDYDADAFYTGTGTKVRHWRKGDYDYTETKYYEVTRKMTASYDNIPADASKRMPDDTMDLIEPYDYKSLLSFDPKYLSGFFGEVYNDVAMSYEWRAQKKAQESATELIKGSISGYATLNPPVSKISMNLIKKNTEYALFPVWIYNFKWGDENYPVYVNGQTKKIVGKTPISKRKVWLYALTHGVVIYAVAQMVLKIMEVL